MYIGPHGHVVIVDADGNAETTVKILNFNYIVGAGIMTFKMSEQARQLKFSAFE